MCVIQGVEASDAVHHPVAQRAAPAHAEVEKSHFTSSMPGPESSIPGMVNHLTNDSGFLSFPFFLPSFPFLSSLPFSFSSQTILSSLE